jgi:hypothetical protein
MPGSALTFLHKISASLVQVWCPALPPFPLDYLPFPSGSHLDFLLCCSTAWDDLPLSLGSWLSFRTQTPLPEVEEGWHSSMLESTSWHKACRWTCLHVCLHSTGSSSYSSFFFFVSCCLRQIGLNLKILLPGMYLALAFPLKIRNKAEMCALTTFFYSFLCCPGSSQTPGLKWSSTLASQELDNCVPHD